MISLLQGRRIDPDTIQVEFKDEKFVNADPEIAKKIQIVWDAYYQEQIGKGIQMQNLDNYRLDSISNMKGAITLHLSVIDYATKIGFREYLKTHPISDFVLDQLPRGIGIGGLLKTADNKYIFAKKSGKTNAKFATGFIGGIPTRDEVVINSGRDLAHHLEEEIFEELGVSIENISEISITDIVLSDSGSIMILTESNINLTVEEVRESFKQRSDKIELSDFIVVPEGDELRELLQANGGYYSYAWELHNSGMDTSEITLR
jgi:hypothetical protein